MNMANVTRSGRKLRDDDNSNGRNSDSKGLSASGSGNSDTCGLRRSSRETPSKKQRISSPLGTRKSERIEKRTPPTPPCKKKLERVEKPILSSPLKRSEGENHHSSSSSGSRKSENDLSLLKNKSKKEKEDNIENYTKVNTKDTNKDGERDQKPFRVVLGKKRLDARTYRQSLLKPLAKKTPKLDLSEKLKKHSEKLQGDSEHAEASCSQDIVAISGELVTNGEEVGGKDDREGPNRALGGTCSMLEAETSKGVGEIEFSDPSRKRKIQLDGFHESNNGCSSSASKFSSDSLQSSLGLPVKEAVGDAEKVQADPSERDNLRKVSMESTSEGRSVKKSYTLGTFKRKRKREEIDSDASMTAANDEPCSSADPVTSLPSECKRGNFLERCDACSHRPRSDVSEICHMCSRNFGNNRDSCNNSSPQEVREQAHTSPNGRTPQQCILKDANKMDIDHDDRNSREDGHGCELLPGAERNEVHDQTDVQTTVGISSSLEEDAGEPTSRTCTGLIEQCSNKTSPDNSPFGTQKDCEDNACVICKHGGRLLCCNGKECRKSYHLHCLDPPLKVVPHGVWHCFQCIKRKIQCGVHSVSSGVESICDVREVEVPYSEGKHKQKQTQYYVKYKGLAHVHNRWIPENQLLLEAPSLAIKFKKNQVPKLKLEWTRPQRLVKKRFLLCSNQRDESFRDCGYEWLVKWTGLGYEHATWELENASFLKSSEAITLIRDYESRLEKAVWASNPSRVKLLAERTLSSLKLSKLPSRSESGVDNDHLNFVNKLREYWHKKQNAVVVEDEARILKVVLFILSMQSDVCRPFLIVSTPSAICAWEAEFMRVAPTVNVVAYTGNKDVRGSIRELEFYGDSGCVMLQVLLSPIDAVIEDLEALELIGWEAIIVDECQRSTVSRHLEQIKKLTNGFRLLLFSGPLKECIEEYLNLLSFIESEGDRNGDVSLKVDSGHTLNKLKERFARFVECERKSDSSKFVEYWVPVRLSNVQLEHYCATLLSNSISLNSCSKTDPVGALRDILISVRKCCDHPYLVDASLQSILMKELPHIEYLDIGVHVSGKFQVLDKILSEIKKRGLRVLILFQVLKSIGGSGGICIGDLLDDFLRLRFGQDSYERVDSVLVHSKKQAALNMFNNKERGRFVFLLENRACSSIIKLSSVDMVILFDSDWNPFNDLRALQKITIQSQFDQLKVFRLYSSCTIEEKVLSLAKQDMALDSNIQNISPSTSSTLLLWGSYFLFHTLDEFHSADTPSFGSNVDETFLNDVVQEFLSQLPSDSENNEPIKCDFVSKAEHSGSSYYKDIVLVGEKEVRSMAEELPHILWTNALNGKYPRWRYVSGPSQRIRRKAHCFDELLNRPRENDEAAKKRKKVIGNTIDQNTLKSCIDTRKSVSIDKEGRSGTPTCGGSHNLLATTIITNSASGTPISGGSHNLLATTINTNSADTVSDHLRDSQKSLYLSLQPVISKLCEIFEFPDDVKSMAGVFLDYIMNNHKVVREPVTIVQAFQISLCWSAASLVNYKISRKKSLSLARQHLDFQCKEEEIHLVLTALRTLRKSFSRQAKSVESISAEKLSPGGEEKQSLLLRASQSTFSAQEELEDGEIRVCPESDKSPNQLDFSKQKQVANSQNASGSSKNGFYTSIKQVEEIFYQRMKKIYQKQMEEFEIFKRNRETILEKEREELETKHKLECAFISKLHRQSSVILEKQKKADEDFARKKEELNIHMETEEEKLKAMQMKARTEEKQMKVHWLEEAKSGRSVSTYAMLPLPDSGFRVENMGKLGGNIVSHESSAPEIAREHVNDCEQVEVGHGKASTSSSRPSLEENEANQAVSVLSEAAPVEICATVPDRMVGTVSTEPPPLIMQLDGRDVEVNNSVSETAADIGSNSISPLEQTLLAPPLNQEHAVPSEDGQVPSLQVPVNEHAQPSLPEADVSRRVEVSGSEVRSLAQVEMQRPQPADALAFNQINDSTPVLSPAVQLQLSPSTDPASTEQSQPGVRACMWVDQLRDPASQQTEVSSPSIDRPTIERSQPEVPASTCSDRASSLLYGQISCVASQQIEVPAPSADSPSSGQNRLEVSSSTCTDRSVLLSDNQLNHATSQFTQVRAPLPDPASNERYPPDVPGSTEQRNERPTSLQEFDAQTQSPLEDLSNLLFSLPDNQSRHTTGQLTQVPAQPPAVEQAGAWDQSASRANAQSQVRLPTASLVVGNESRLSDPRSMGLFPEFSPRPPHASSSVTSRNSQQLVPDPLQYELGRINKEKEDTTKMHDNERMRLNAECEKEMEEIRRKYSAKLQAADAEFMQKKKALETNYTVVYMNRILAEAFRMKCDAVKCDAKAGGAPAVQQGEPPGFAQLLAGLSTSQSARIPAYVPTPSTALPTSSLTQMANQSSAHLSSSPVPSTAPPTSSLMQRVNQTSAFFASNPVRPQFSQVLSPSGNHQIGTELRAPAPHLQPFRPMTSTPGSSRGPAISTGTATNVVYLSDDD